MPLLLIALFVGVPIVELWAIGRVADGVGWSWTFALLIIDSVIGAILVRREGRRAWAAFREALASGRWPGDEVAQGALLLIGATLLLTPGFVTDVVGLLLVLPPSRSIASKVLRRRITPGPVQVIADAAAGARRATGQPRPPRGRAAASGDIVDVEVVSIERHEATEPPGGSSPGPGLPTSGEDGSPAPDGEEVP